MVFKNSPLNIDSIEDTGPPYPNADLPNKRLHRWVYIVLVGSFLQLVCNFL